VPAEEREDGMRQQTIQRIVSKLLQDEKLRDTFLNDPHRALLDLLEQDTNFTYSEIAALTALDASFWEEVAEYVEPVLTLAA
jgi:hypothetical protein